MNEITKSLIPNYKETNKPDTRFLEDLQVIQDAVGNAVLEDLKNFADKKLALELNHQVSAYKLCNAFIDRAEHVERNEDRNSITNKFKWRSKALIKLLRTWLAELGFKPIHVTKTIGACKFMRDMKLHTDDESIKFYSWADSLGVGSKYELSNMEGAHPNYYIFGTWDSNSCYSIIKRESEDFTKPISKHKLEAIRQKFPKIERDPKGAKPNPLNRLHRVEDTNPLDDVTEHIILMTKKLDTNEAKTEALEILKDTEERLSRLSKLNRIEATRELTHSNN